VDFKVGYLRRILFEGLSANDTGNKEPPFDEYVLTKPRTLQMKAMYEKERPVRGGLTRETGGLMKKRGSVTSTSM
jgi:hypothetical protein